MRGKFRILLPAGIIVLSVSLAFINGCNPDENEKRAEMIKVLESFTYLTEHYPPLNYEQEGLLYGLSVDIIEELFKKMDVVVSRKDIILMNWSEAYHQALNVEHTVLFSTAKLAEREGKLKWVGPIVPVKYIAIAKKSSNIHITKLSDLNNYSPGVIRDDAGHLILKEYSIGTLVLFDDVEQLFSALQNGGISCAVYSELGSSLILESMKLKADDFEVITMVAVIEAFFAFHTGTSDELISFFQENLDILKMDKTVDGSSVYEKILNKYQVIQHINDNITTEMVITLVQKNAADIAKDATGTFSKMNQQLPPYKDPVTPALYSFVYDTAINIMAHADNKLMVGQNFRGKTDAAGKKFRDEIVAGALKNQTGWVDYIYTKPDQSGLYYKTAYYQLVTGSDGKLYIVCAGRFK